ncbi:MazG-like family protein [Candidatus Dependentiae bacterium]|nr:MazG-like family protein [Candidatus Dependentiae bacterium]
MNIKECQDTVSVLFKNISHPRIGAYIALTEETGELGKEIMEKEIYGQDTGTDKIKAELCDVMVCVFELANLYGVDLDSSLKTKFDYINSKISKWESLYSKNLELKRKKFD